jgi:hypothetical protein
MSDQLRVEIIVRHSLSPLDSPTPYQGIFARLGTEPPLLDAMLVFGWTYGSKVGGRVLVGRCDFHLPQSWEWNCRAVRPGWPTQRAWTSDYVDRDGRPHTVTVSDWEDPHTRVLVDGVQHECKVEHTIQNPNEK